MIETDDLLEEFESWLRSDFVFMDSSSSVTITPRGWAELEELLGRDSALPHFERLSALADLGLYDTAIREAGVLLETALREATGSEQFGLRLVNMYVSKLKNDKRWNTARVRRLRGDLRTAFKFIRNEFAHQVAEVPRDRALALLARLTSLIEVVRATSRR